MLIVAPFLTCHGSVFQSRGPRLEKAQSLCFVHTELKPRRVGRHVCMGTGAKRPRKLRNYRFNDITEERVGVDTATSDKQRSPDVVANSARELVVQSPRHTPFETSTGSTPTPRRRTQAAASSGHHVHVGAQSSLLFHRTKVDPFVQRLAALWSYSR